MRVLSHGSSANETSSGVPCILDVLNAGGQMRHHLANECLSGGMIDADNVDLALALLPVEVEIDEVAPLNKSKIVAC